MFKLIMQISIITALLASNTSAADTLVLKYQHNYLSKNKFHTDNLNYDYRFQNGFHIGVGANLFNKATDKFDNPSLHSTLLNTSYHYDINHILCIIPRIEFMFYSGTNPRSSGIPSKVNWSGEIGDNGTSGVKYKPGITIVHTPLSWASLYFDYEYDLRKLARFYRDVNTQPNYGGKDHRKNKFTIGTNLNVSRNIDVGYNLKFIQANYDLYNNSKNNYEQSLILMYRLSREWQPFFEVQDKASSTTNSLREAVIGAGFNYHF